MADRGPSSGASSGAPSSGAPSSGAPSSSRPAATPEPAFPIGLVALDIDGTIVGDNLVLGERTIDAIRAARSRGVAISLVTGRMVTSALPFVTTLGLVDPVVGYQGALIRAMPGPDRAPGRLGRILAHRPLAADVARDAVTWSRSVGLDPHVNHLETFVIRTDDPRADDYSRFLGGRATFVPDLLAWLERPVSKVISVSEGPIPESILADGRAAFAGRAEVTISHPRFLEFLAPGVSKAAAVRRLARRAGVTLGNVLAIGDQFNDLEMIGAVGHGAAMPSAPAPVRAVARYLAPPLAAEGAAQLIERLVLASPAAAARAAADLAEAHRAGAAA